MATLTYNQLANLAYEGPVFEVKFIGKAPRSSVSFVKAEVSSDLYKKPEIVTYSYLAPGMQAMAGDFAAVPVEGGFTIAEIVTITDETALNLNYPYKYQFTVSVIPKESMQEYNNKVLVQKEQMAALKKQKHKVLRQQLKEAFFAENANLLSGSAGNTEDEPS